MHLHSYRLRNFRRLRDVHVELASDISIFVGANNSGKTSATQAIRMFVAGDDFSVHDFHCSCWDAFEAAGEWTDETEARPAFPTISIDMWFDVGADNLHRVIDLLPNLDWENSLVGLRVEFAPKDEESLLRNFQEAKAQSASRTPDMNNAATGYTPWPKSMVDYLSKRLKAEYELRYYVLDRAHFDPALSPLPDYVPMRIVTEKGRSGGQILKSLVQVDCLHAQRHLSDNTSSTSSGRAENLSKRLSHFYKRNLELHEEDHAALQALAASEAQLNDHLERVFEPTLKQLSHLGYPGFANPRLVIKSALNPTTIMSQDAKVHYALGDLGDTAESVTLPDSYNGLGFKNLIYIVVELLDFHARWLDEGEERPPLHLIFIEEPEAHLHAQLQQVFIRRVLDLLKVEGEDAIDCCSQVVVTTHSPHILYERGFKPIRYFRRVEGGLSQKSEVLNLSSFYGAVGANDGDFLARYLKLTHCDLFFADAAVLVEGNVERLLLPVMIEKVAQSLQSVCLSILEVGGAYAHRFRSLIEFLGITTLVITDIDSVSTPVAPTVAVIDCEADDEEDDEDGQPATKAKACLVSSPGAVTSNQTLRQWLPRKHDIADLLVASEEDRTQAPSLATSAHIRVVYQRETMVSWNGTSTPLSGRTLEETFALENLEWTQDKAQKHLGLRIGRNTELSLTCLAERIHKRVKGRGFNKTSFALGVLTEDQSKWVVPTYITEGIRWISQQVSETADPAQKSARVPMPNAETAVSEGATL